MGFFLLLGLLLCIIGTPMCRVNADYFLHHPQRQFCSAGFVVSARVMRSDDMSRAYHVKVLYVFKDEVDLSKAEGTSLSYGLKLKVYNSAYDVQLHVGKVYILAGQLKDGKLQMDKGDWIFQMAVEMTKNGSEWKDVSPTQEEGLYFRYKRGCKCKIGFSYGDSNFSQKVSGCEYSALENRPRFDVCRMNCQYCEMKEDQGTKRCQWKSRSTDEFKDCEKKIP